MRSNKLLTIWAGLIAAVSLVAMITVQQGTKVYDISLGIFCSALLSCFMSYAQYLVSKREVMENFYIEFLKLIGLFNKFPCIDINMPLQLFNDSLVERLTNNIFSDIPGQAIHQARDKIKYWKYPKEKQSDMTCSLDEKVDQQINKNIERAEQIVCDYHKTINKDNFDAAWGNICFFSKSYQKKVYDNLYRPLKNLVNSFNAEQWHLEMYCDGDNNNLPVVFNKCVELSTKLYNRQEINSDKDFQVRITSKLPSWYSGPLLNFWINTYHPNKAEIIEESKSYQEIEPVVYHITDKKGL